MTSETDVFPPILEREKKEETSKIIKIHHINFKSEKSNQFHLCVYFEIRAAKWFNDFVSRLKTHYVFENNISIRLQSWVNEWKKKFLLNRVLRVVFICVGLQFLFHYEKPLNFYWGGGGGVVVKKGYFQ